MQNHYSVFHISTHALTEGDEIFGIRFDSYRLLSYHKFRQRQLVIPPFKSSIYFVYLKSVYFYSAFQSYFC